MDGERGSPAWAIWNDCQGVFMCSVFRTKAEAEQCLQNFSFGDAAKIVPVKVVVEPESRWPDREWEEAQRR